MFCSCLSTAVAKNEMNKSLIAIALVLCIALVSAYRNDYDDYIDEDSQVLEAPYAPEMHLNIIGNNGLTIYKEGNSNAYQIDNWNIPSKFQSTVISNIILNGGKVSLGMCQQQIYICKILVRMHLSNLNPQAALVNGLVCTLVCVLARCVGMRTRQTFCVCK